MTGDGDDVAVIAAPAPLSLAYRESAAPRRPWIVALGTAALVFGLVGFVAGVVTLYRAFPGHWGIVALDSNSALERLSVLANAVYMFVRIVCCGVMLLAGLWIVLRRRGGVPLLVAYVVLEFLAQVVSMLPPALALTGMMDMPGVWWMWLVQVGYVGCTALMLGLLIALLRTQSTRDALGRATRP